MVDASLLEYERDVEQSRAAAMEVGVEGNPQRFSGDGRVVTNWERELTKRGSTAATLRGREATLRAKQRRTRSADEGAWRAAMASAFMLVLRGRKAAKSAIVARAESVGEGEYARCVMLPMLDEKFPPNPSPEFPGNIVSTHEAK
jgi:hypothetical protein